MIRFTYTSSQVLLTLNHLPLANMLGKLLISFDFFKHNFSNYANSQNEFSSSKHVVFTQIKWLQLYEKSDASGKTELRIRFLLKRYGNQA